PPQSRGPERLDRLLQVRPQPLERGPDPSRKALQAALYAGASMPQLRVQAHPVEVPRQRADVRRDRHAVVVQHDPYRRPHAPPPPTAWLPPPTPPPPVTPPSPITATTFPSVPAPTCRMPSLIPTA